MADGTIVPRPFDVIKDSADVIAPGTTGQWDNKTFAVTGRFRIWAEETVFSYWTIIFQDETAAYLLEGYGMYSICIPVATPPELQGDAIKNLMPGNKKLLNKQEYVLLRKDHCLNWDVEGELYMPECNSAFTCFDFSSAKGQLMHIIEYWPQVQPAFKVHNTDFRALALQNLRPYENAGKTFKCSHCSREVHVATFPYAQSCVCSHCNTRHVLNDHRQFTAYNNGTLKKAHPSIHLGATGIIKDIPYKVIGYIVKEERNQYRSQWREYTLFNEQEGFAFLSEYDGHWIYLREQGKAPVPEDIGTAGFNYEGDSFDLFNSYNYSVVSAAGEFPGNAFNDSQIKCWEFISPPIMWNREQSPKEGIVWLKGWHVGANTLKEAFGDAVMPPPQVGVGAVQPNGYVDLRKLLMNTLIAIGVLVAIHLASTASNKEQTLMSSDIYFSDSSNVQHTVLGDVHLDKRKSNVMLELNSLVENTWIEVEATLVDKKDGSEYSVSKGVEFYTGFEDGERWTEGAQRANIYINEVPRGDYTLKLQATREGGFFPVKSYNITAYYDVTNTRNLFICIGLLLLWPLFKYFSTYYSERKRWENSPYSTFSTYE
jgi:hypothetical protein